MVLETLSRPAVRVKARPAAARVLFCGGFVGLLAIVSSILLYVNNTAPYLPYHDSWEYLRRARDILAGGPWVDPIRMPGYPLLIAVVTGIQGSQDLRTLTLMEFGLFVVAAVEIYALAYQIWQRPVVATALGAAFATNVYLLSFFKPILSDGLAVCLALAVALALTRFLERGTALSIWLVALFLLALLMTRADWFLLPLPLFAYVLLVAHRRGRFRRTLPHVVASACLLFGVTGAYALFNGRLNGYTGLTDASNINLFGKITQYNMQGQAPAKYARIAAVTERFVRHGLRDPWSIYRRAPALGRAHFAPMGSYAHAIIVRHPLEFLAKSIPVFFRSLTADRFFAAPHLHGPWGGVLFGGTWWAHLLFLLFALFPLVAVLWVVPLVRGWRHQCPAFRAEALCALSLMALYDLTVTTLGSYDEYTRLHLSLDPLMLVVTGGTLLVVAPACVRWCWRQLPHNRQKPQLARGEHETGTPEVPHDERQLVA